MANKKNNKAKVIKKGDEFMVIKKCACCTEEFEQLSPTQAYCEVCRNLIHKMYTMKRKKNMIYIFEQVIKNYEGEVLYIGSTDNICNRVSEHLGGYTTASKKLKGKVFDIYYAEVNGVNRDELYFIEYYLIDRYKAIFCDIPVGNSHDAYKREDIPTSRQSELMEIADGLKFDTKYDVRRHRVNSFNNNITVGVMDIIKELSKESI